MGRLRPFAWHLSVMRSLVSICMPQGCDGVQVVALSIGPLCRHDITRSDRQIGNVSVTYITLIPWWRERRRYVPMPQSWTIAGCLGLVLGSSAENLMSGCTCRPFIPVCTGSGSGMQNPLANIHWCFLLSQRWLGLPSKSPMSSRHNVSVPSIRERGLRM